MPLKFHVFYDNIRNLKWKIGEDFKLITYGKSKKLKILGKQTDL